MLSTKILITALLEVLLTCYPPGPEDLQYVIYNKS